MNIEKNRHLIILDALTKSREPITAEQLALLSRSSVRTIKNDLAQLRQQLAEEETAEIESLKAKGYVIKPIHEWLYAKLLMNIEVMMRVFYNRSIEETNRRMYIVQRILTEENVLIDDICEALFVSRSVISRDIEWAIQFLQSYDLDVQSVPGRGLVMKGSEREIRNAMVEVHCSQYHDFQQLYPYEPFNQLFYDDKQDYEDIRHAFLAILRNTSISLYDLGAKKVPTYMCLVKSRVRQGRLIELDESVKREIMSTYDYEIACRIADELRTRGMIDFPEIETVNLARVIMINRNIDMRSNGPSGIPVSYIMENERIYKKVMTKARKQIGKTLLNAEFFRLFEVDFESLQLELYLKRRFDSTKEKKIINYIESDETLLSPLSLEMARIMIGYLQQEFHEKIRDSITTFYAAIYERILKKVTYPYRKLRLLATATEGLVYGNHMKENLIGNFSRFIDKIDVYNLYEMRKVNFNDYDALIHSGHLLYYVYPLKSVAFNELDYQNNQNSLFAELFRDGYDRSRIGELKRILNVYGGVSIDDVDTFMESLTFRYTRNPEDQKKMVEEYYYKRDIIDYYSNRQNSMLVMLEYGYTGREFIDVYVPAHPVYYHGSLEVKFIITASLNPDNSVTTIKIDNHVLQYLTQVDGVISRLAENRDQALDDIYDRIIERSFFNY